MKLWTNESPAWISGMSGELTGDLVISGPVEVSVSDGGVEDQLDQQGGVVDGQEGVGHLAQPGQHSAHPVLVVFVAVVSWLGREHCPALNNSVHRSETRESY